MRQLDLVPPPPELHLSEAWIAPAIAAESRNERYRFLAIGFALTALAFLIGYVASPGFRGSIDRLTGHSITIAIPDLPEVEPLILKKVSMDRAREVNAATPYTTKPIVPAAPFLFRGTEDNKARAIDCLAATLYYEAGNEAISGQMAVIQVVLNRVRHPAYPNTVCGVVFQGHERSTGCQFSYTCDGSMARRKPTAAAWSGYRTLARSMLEGLTYTPVGLATHYHTDWVLPAWSARLEKLRAERSHLFFRYAGYWGTPVAFKGRVSGVEPRFALMSGLSEAHGGAGLEDEGEIADLPAELTGLKPDSQTLPDNVSSVPVPEDLSKDTFLLYVDPLLGGSDLETMAKRTCGNRTRCKVLAWADEALMPKGLPIDNAERAAMAFSYVRDGKAKGRPAWNCTLYPEQKGTACLKR